MKNSNVNIVTKMLGTFAVTLLLLTLSGCVIYVKGPMEPSSGKKDSHSTRRSELRPYHAEVQFTGTYADAKTTSARPVPIDVRGPRFPAEAKRLAAGASLSATVHFIVKADGTVDQVQVQDADDTSLVEPAIEALKMWKFKPGEVNGAPVDCAGIIVMRFKEND
ncbi:MAG: energy transducer TonB [Nibricoccus sp.]